MVVPAASLQSSTRSASLCCQRSAALAAPLAAAGCPQRTRTLHAFSTVRPGKLLTCRATSSSNISSNISNDNNGSFQQPSFSSIQSLQERQQLLQVQMLQQRRQLQLSQQGVGAGAGAAAAAGQVSGEDTDLLWAGYSALEEQLHRHHRRHDALVEQIHDLQAKLQAVQQQPPVSAWQAASFLLFFLFFINFVGLLSSLQVGFMLPWTAAKASAGSMWIKGLLSFAVPFTNTLVTLIFCMQAIKAALTCLKW